MLEPPLLSFPVLRGRCVAPGPWLRGFASVTGGGTGGAGDLNHLQEKIASLCKRRGFVFPNSEIYGGFAGSFDYGPLGSQLKKNIKDCWWRDFVELRRDCVGLDTPILMNREVWKAAGHVDHFNDYMAECKECQQRFRADKLLEECGLVENAGKLSLSELQAIFREKRIMPVHCPRNPKGCNIEDIRPFNLMFSTTCGPTSGAGHEVFLRPETAQGIFISFVQTYTAMRKRLPFGVGQIGKSFRNEVSPANFLFRMREFEQMELEYFCHSNESQEKFDHWVEFCYEWLLKHGLKASNLMKRKHDASELAHYSRCTTDIEYRFPFGWGEIWGISHRGSFDLEQHMKHSKQDLRYRDLTTGELTLPHVIEPAAGLDRLLLAFLTDAYHEEDVPSSSDGGSGTETRVVLKLAESLAPFKYAVMPLMKRQELATTAHKLFDRLSTIVATDYDDTGSIGRRYRRQDEIGTPYCVTIDYTTLQDDTVTIRSRDSMLQQRLPIKALLHRASSSPAS
ncbi:Glycine--tRNA ligase [Balamuthia mandrillaris]